MKYFSFIFIILSAAPLTHTMTTWQTIKEYASDINYCYKNRSFFLTSVCGSIAVETTVITFAVSPTASLIINIPLSALAVWLLALEGKETRERHREKATLDLCFSRTIAEAQKALQSGAVINSICTYRFDPINLHLPIYHLLRHGNISIAEFLKSKGANIAQLDVGRRPLLMALIKKVNPDKHDTLASIQWLLENGANIEAQDDCGDAAVHRACGKKNLAVLKLLAENGADLTKRSHREETPLHRCVKNNFLEGIDFLLSKKVDPNSRNRHSKTPLHYAIEQQSAGTVYRLIEHGARLSQEDPETQTMQELYQNHKNNIACGFSS